MIDDDILNEIKAKSLDDVRKTFKSKSQRIKFPEETLAKNENVVDFRNTKHSFKNWSALIPVRILKERLRVEESSYLTNATSKFTFIRKTRSFLMRDDNVLDINLMPPMIVKNCLPFSIVISFRDCSNVE